MNDTASDASFVAHYYKLHTRAVMCNIYERVINYQGKYVGTYAVGDIGYIEDLILQYCK